MYPVYSILPVFINCLRRAGVDNCILFSISYLLLFTKEETPIGCYCLGEWCLPSHIPYGYLWATGTTAGMWNLGPLLQSGVKTDAGVFQTLNHRYNLVITLIIALELAEPWNHLPCQLALKQAKGFSDLQILLRSSCSRHEVSWIILSKH